MTEEPEEIVMTEEPEEIKMTEEPEEIKTSQPEEIVLTPIKTFQPEEIVLTPRTQETIASEQQPQIDDENFDIAELEGDLWEELTKKLPW